MVGQGTRRRGMEGSKVVLSKRKSLGRRRSERKDV